MSHSCGFTAHAWCTASDREKVSGGGEGGEKKNSFMPYLCWLGMILAGNRGGGGGKKRGKKKTCFAEARPGFLHRGKEEREKEKGKNL